MEASFQVEIGPASTQAGRQGILALQAKNLERNISAETLAQEGFVTVEHDLATLEAISGDHFHVVARTQSGEVVGYVLVMLREYAGSIPVLVPMFQAFDGLSFRGKRLEATRYFVMGQVCIDVDHRGTGLFRRLYEGLFRQMETDFELVLTEVAARNPRSIRAHEKVGFEVVERYGAEGEEWVILGRKLS